LLLFGANLRKKSGFVVILLGFMLFKKNIYKKNLPSRTRQGLHLTAVAGCYGEWRIKL
jgi:hypothetical protein